MAATPILRGLPTDGVEYGYRCIDCGTFSPAAATRTAARALLKDAGWSRIYRGSGEGFRCPDCRSGRGAGPVQVDDVPFSDVTPRLIARALLYTGTPGSTESFTDHELNAMATYGRHLLEVLGDG